MVTYGAMSSTVVVTGIGVVSPFGATREQFRDALLSGRSGIAPITAFDVSGCRARTGASVTGFDATAWIPPMKLRRMDDTARYAVVATRQALEDAGYPFPTEGDDDAGIVLGTFTAGGQATSEYLTALHKGGPTGAPALLFNSTVANAPASLAGLEFKLRGPNVTVSQKEASGLAAVVTATDALRLGRSRAIATGGVDAIFDIFFRVHDRFRVMSPALPSAFRGPFDRGRDGFVLGEGGYALVLEQGGSSSAHRRLYGEILGVSAQSAAVPINAWPTTTDSLVRTMRDALDDAGLTPQTVDVIYASANATALDAIEAAAIRELFAPHRPLVTSIKGAVGEFGASGAASLAAALLCGCIGEIPPIAGLQDIDAAAEGLRLVRARTTLPGNIALINSFASGGSLFSVVLRITRD
jgi:3-oxoacyl-[acyl-carrier-protein] synthase II